MEIKSLEEMTESEKIKLYITIAKEAPEETTAGPRNINIHYNVTLSSGLDAVIERVDRKSIKSLILMPSQDTYVFKQDDAIQDVKTTSQSDFFLFFNHMPEAGITINNIIIDTLKKEDLFQLYNMIISMNKELKEGLMSLALYKSNLYQNLKIDKKIWKLITTKTPILKNTVKYNRDFIDMVLNFSEIRGYDAAYYFVENYTKSSMADIDNFNRFYYRNCVGSYDNCHTNSTNANIIKLKELDTKRLIDYLCFDLYAQGFYSIQSQTYYDYLRMSLEYDEKIKDKYPNNLLTAHDIMSLKYDQYKLEIDKQMFKDRLDEFVTKLQTINPGSSEKVGYDSGVLFKYQDKTLLLPKESNELIEEGQNLGHCVGSYVQRMINGECFIGFVRKDSNLEQSYLTVEFRPINEYGKINYSIAQIQGDCKRTNLTKDEKDFFVKYMKKSGFKTSSKHLE